MSVTIGTKVIAGWILDENASSELIEFADSLKDSEMAFQIEDVVMIGLDVSEECERLIDGNTSSLYIFPPSLFTSDKLETLRLEIIEALEECCVENDIDTPDDFLPIMESPVQITLHAEYG